MNGPPTPRQRELLDVAARLFAQRGYYAVGINDISAELKLSGPAFYRHYPSKQALLVAVLDAAMTTHLEEVDELVASIADPRERLEAIVAHHLDFAFEQTDNIMTWRTEFRVLPEGDRRRLRYLQGLYVQTWVRTLRQLRPDLTTLQLKAICYAAIALIQSHTSLHNQLPREELQPILHALAVTALTLTPLVSSTAPRRDESATAHPSQRNPA